MSIALEDALVSGIPIGAGQVAKCDRCNACLRPNHRVELLVTITPAAVDIATTRCLACATGSLHPQTIRPCWLVRGRVQASLTSSGRSQLILGGASVIDRTTDE